MSILLLILITDRLCVSSIRTPSVLMGKGDSVPFSEPPFHLYKVKEGEMGYGIKLKVWGEGACFSRPEMKVERITYDVITPSAARGILEAIHWKPAIRWVIDKIHVLNEIQFDTIRRNEVKGVISANKVKKVMQNKEGMLYQNALEDRTQRATVYLKDVAYIIEAHFDIVKFAARNSPAKHYAQFIRRAGNGQCINQPYFGCREFPVKFELYSDESIQSFYSDVPEKDLGWMLWDIDFKNHMQPIFFRAKMKNGTIDVSSGGDFL